MDILARGKYVITDANAGESGILTDGAVYFSEGKVAEVGNYGSLKKKYPEAIVKGNEEQLLMPGLIDGHSHGWGLSCTQRGGSDQLLEDQLIEGVGLIELQPKTNAMMSAVRHIRNGCTTMHHNSWGEEPNRLELAEKSIEGYKEVGIRLAYSLGGRNMNRLAYGDTEFFTTLPPSLQEVCRDMVYYDKKQFVDDYFTLFNYLYSRYNNSDTHIILGPSWVQGCTVDFLQRVKARADELGKIQIHIHTLESLLQKAYSLRKYGKSLVAYLDDIGLIDNNLTLGHALYVTKSDIELLGSRHASVTHHPSCNLALRNGIAPVYYLQKAGVNVVLGIDNRAINDDEDAIMELRMIHQLHRVLGSDLTSTPTLDAFDVLKMGTTNAARVCSFEGELGALKPGMKADAILLDLHEMMEDPWTSPNLNIAEIFIHRAKGTHVNTVIVGGKVIMEDRKFLTVDVDQLYREVRKQVERGVNPQQRCFAEVLQKIKPYYRKWYKGWQKLDLEPFYVMNSQS